MSYRIPVFAITVNIWRDGTRVTDPPDAISAANLAMGRRTSKGDTADIPFDPSQLPTLDLLLPMGADIMGDVDTGGTPDICEIPQGSGSYWRVHWVHPVGLGFPNEHVRAVVTPIVGVPPSSTSRILTEGGDFIVTETGDHLITE